MMPDGATGNRTKNCMVMGEMSRHGADSGALETSRRSGWNGRHGKGKRSRKRDNGASHGRSSPVNPRKRGVFPPRIKC
jgi:hypothetical protein